jgi:drug/metabolite transporter (DMT)-like permease
MVASTEQPAGGTAVDARMRLRGVAILLLSSAIFAFSNAIAKWSAQAFPIGEAMMIRSAVAVVLIAPFARPTAMVRALGANPGLHLLRVAFSAGEVGCFYWALASLQLVDVTTFYLAAPILLTVIAALSLNEGIGRARWLATLAGFAGVLIALRPSSAAVSSPALIALAGSTMYSVVLAATRQLHQTPKGVLVASQFIVLLAASAATVPFAWVTPSPAQALMLGLVGVLSMLGNVAVARAFQLAPASALAPFQYVSILWSALFGYLAFADVPDGATLLGAAIIIGAGLFILLRERRLVD